MMIQKTRAIIFILSVLVNSGWILDIDLSQGLADGMEHHHDSAHMGEEGSHTLPEVDKPLYFGKEALAKQVGIEIVSLTTTGGGLMLDLRYRVVDAAAAKEAFKKRINEQMMIMDPNTGYVLAFPNDDHRGWLKSSSPNPQNNQVFFSVYYNVAGKIKQKSQVSIIAGKVQVDGIQVQ